LEDATPSSFGSGAARVAFSTANPNIFAPDLSSQNNSNTSDKTNRPPLPVQAGLKHAFSRQQELLHQEHRFRMLAGRHQAVHSHPLNSSPTDPMQQSQPRPNQLQAIEEMFRMNQSSSSRQHSMVIQAAMNALQSCNDRAYLTMLMTNEAKFGTSPAALSSSEVRDNVHYAMQAQMRQLEEYNRNLAGVKSSAESTNVKTNATAVTPNQVAQLHNEIKHQTPGSQQNPDTTQSRFPRGVRRASAA
jgi:hypothetical protein